MAPDPIRTETVSFAGALGARLAARLDGPERPQAYALFAHCFTCSKNSVAAARIARGLARNGIATLRFDFTGLGESGGDFASTGFASNVDDMVRAADWLREHRAAPLLLVGHSLGGAAVLAAAARIPEARAVATLASPADPAHVLRLFTEARPDIEAQGEAEVAIGGRRFRIRREFLAELEAERLDGAIAGLRRALLVMHAPGDDIVGIDQASRIFLAARHPKSFVSLDDADHLLTRPADAGYAADVLAAWASRYIGDAEEARSDDTGPPPGTVVVEESGAGLRQSIRIGRHRLVADEPVAAGGHDDGPSPYDFLLAGLGACTTMTLRLYAERKQLPLAGVRVMLRHGKIHARDCADCETKEGRIDRIEREIALTGNLDDAQRARLMEIADRCPVHRTLKSEIDIRTRSATADSGEDRGAS